MNCVFCRIIAGEEFAIVIAEWKETVAFLPLGAVAEGHVLFVPREHVVAAHEVPAITAQVAGRAAEWALAAQKVAKHRVSQPEEYNLITSYGPAATQSIAHLHIHYVPRRAGDGLALPWTGQTETKGALA